MIAINGTALPSPSALSVRTALKAGSAGYNTLGQLVQDNMREKRTVEITWNRMPGPTLSALAALSDGADFLTLVYPDPLAGDREMACRITARSARVYSYQAGVPTWADVKLTMEER